MPPARVTKWAFRTSTGAGSAAHAVETTTGHSRNAETRHATMNCPGARTMRSCRVRMSGTLSTVIRARTLAFLSLDVYRDGPCLPPSPHASSMG